MLGFDTPAFYGEMQSIGPPYAAIVIAAYDETIRQRKAARTKEERDYYDSVIHAFLHAYAPRNLARVCNRQQEDELQFLLDRCGGDDDD